MGMAYPFASRRLLRSRESVYRIILLWRLVLTLSLLGPWWLVRHGRFDDARATLTRIAEPGYWDDRNIDAYIAVIQHTDDLERAEAKTGSFWELFKGTNLRRTEIVYSFFLFRLTTKVVHYRLTFNLPAGPRCLGYSSMVWDGYDCLRC